MELIKDLCSEGQGGMSVPASNEDRISRYCNTRDLDWKSGIFSSLRGHRMGPIISVTPPFVTVPSSVTKE